ncbi:MAG: hypothetical protein L0I62_05285 [Gammaproteobacteria bacterium]|nr:hypothetical protein [Gammaproteobacteria bacterium]
MYFGVFTRNLRTGFGMHAMLGTMGFLLAIAVSGCSLLSPPPSIEYLKSLPPDAIQKAHPANIRLAIKLPKGVQLIDLQAKVTDVSGAKNPDSIRGTLSFQIVPDSQALAPPPISVPAKGVWTYYKLDAQGRKEFSKIQAYAKTHPPGKIQTTITVHLSNKLKLTDCNYEGKMRLVAAIMLDPQRGYAVVLNRMETVSELAPPEKTICASASGQVPQQAGALVAP